MVLPTSATNKTSEELTKLVFFGAYIGVYLCIYRYVAAEDVSILVRATLDMDKVPWPKDWDVFTDMKPGAILH